jgi:5-methylcytosine-specific restriction endonuclease McrA
MYWPNMATSRYCSIPCRALAKRKMGRNGGWARAWRFAVFRRDAFTCQDCGQHGGELHAHHIVGWAVDPTRRFDVANGVTLCLACHQRQHPWMQPYRR